MWRWLDYDVFVPARTGVLFRVRTSETAETLEDADWTTIATVPEDESPAAINTALEDAMAESEGRYLELEVQLSSANPDSSPPLTPAVYNVAVSYECPAIVY